MNKKEGFLHRAGDFFSGKGFYIVLFLCVVVIGVSAWAMLTLGNNTAEIDQIEGQVAEVTSELSDDVAAGAVMAGQDAADDITEDAVYASDEPAESPTETAEDETTSLMTNFVWPVRGEVITENSTTDLIYDKTMADWRTHAGIDISAEVGTPVLAINGGTVRSITDDDLYGTTVTIDHGDDLESVYSNLATTPTVAIGQEVASGETIGAVGDTAIVESGIVSHLHLEVLSSGVKVDPMDYLPAG